MIAHRAWSGYHLRAYARYCWLRVRRPYVQTEGLVFLGRGVRLRARRGYGRLIIGRYAHIGDGTALRAHEGTLRIGTKAVLAADVTVNCYLHVEIGSASLLADDVYVCDFDHRHEDLTRPIKDQGIVKAPVRIGADVWIGTKTAILRDVDVGRGAVIGANSVVTRDIPAYAIAAGAPARIIGSRHLGGSHPSRRRRNLIPPGHQVWSPDAAGSSDLQS